jgi:uncharacterized protein YjbI with pentapeptide repeats
MEKAGMANEEHLGIFKQGVEAWNRWREMYPSIHPDLSRLNFWSLEISDPYLMETLWNVWLPESQAYELKDVNFASTNLRGACLSSADLRGARFHSADLSFADLRHATADRAQFRDARLKVAKLAGLCGSHADLSGADLENSDLSGADLSHANLTRANLKGVNFTGANLEGANLTQSLLQWSLLVDLDLSQVNGLDTVQHYGRSSIGMDTIGRSNGRIPEVFLKGCGLSALEIEYARLAAPGLGAEGIIAVTERMRKSCLGRSPGSCFISFDPHDEEFAWQLRADLQSHDIRCWFVPEHRRFGNPIRPALDRQKRLREKLIVILSKEAIQNEWIGEEVEAALEEEMLANRLVVLPLRLDDAVLSAQDDWAAHLKHVHPIPDFRNWTEEGQHSRLLQQLLRELRVV